MASPNDYLRKFSTIYYLNYVRNLIQILGYPSQPTENLKYEVPNRLERIVRKIPK